MNTLLSQEYINVVNGGRLATLQPSNPVPLIMGKDEELLYIENGYTEKTTTHTSGYKSKSKGVSFRVAKGVRLHLGGGSAKAKRQTEIIKTAGLLYITNKRIVWSSPTSSFEYPVSKITSVFPYRDSISIQSGNKTYDLYIPTPETFYKVFYMLTQKLSESD